MPYRVLRNLLFNMDAEKAHELSLNFLKICHRARLTWIFGKTLRAPFHAKGLEFGNRAGLAAGFDKNGDYIDALASLGFGFIEVGTVTPRPQSGNEKPRLFRLTDCRSVINRMGFNNKGVNYLVDRLGKKRFSGVVGVNIGKNATTSIENAHEDYLYCLDKVYPEADYVTVNVSSPNTPGLRLLQLREHLESLLESIAAEREKLSNKYGKFVPVLVKISPDLSESELISFAKVFNDSNLDGVVATNTTLSRQGLETSVHAGETGGLSGFALKERAFRVLTALRTLLDKDALIVASGGIMNSEDALQRVRAGAGLVQLYTGLVYTGPGLVRDVAEKLKTVPGKSKQSEC